MSGPLSGLQGFLSAVLLPPILLMLLVLAAGLLAWRGLAWGGLVAAAGALGLLVLATPLVADLLMASLEREVPRAEPAPGAGAIIILGGDVAHGAVFEPGPLTLERLRAGAALHRATGLPILVTGGVLGRGEPPLAAMMARSLVGDFAVTPRWVEPRAADTRENAVFAVELLRKAGIGEALLVTHAWHMPRALGAFARLGFRVHARPLRIDGTAVDWGLWSLAPRPDRLAESWFAIREWAGILAYALRDGGPAGSVSANLTSRVGKAAIGTELAEKACEFFWSASCLSPKPVVAPLDRRTPQMIRSPLPVRAPAHVPEMVP